MSSPQTNSEQEREPSVRAATAGAFPAAAAKDSTGAAREALRPAAWAKFMIFRRAIRDGSISAGAFRLWHYYRDCMDGDGRVQGMFARADFITRALHCNRTSLFSWNKELQEAGWLTWSAVGRRNIYDVLDGLGGAARKGAAERQTATPPAAALPQYSNKYSRAPHSTHMSTMISTQTSTPANSICKGTDVRGKSPPARELWVIQKELDRTRQEIQVTLRAPSGPERARRLSGLRQLERKLEFELIGEEPPATEAAPPRVQVSAGPKCQPVPPERWSEIVLKLTAKMREEIGR